MSDKVERLRDIAEAIVDGNRRELTMRIPAEPDRDADLVISWAADEITRLRAEVDEQRKLRDSHGAQAERWHAEVERLTKERDRLRESVNAEIDCRNAVMDHRDELLAERDALQSRIDACVWESYVSPEQAEAIRLETIEKCAKVCDKETRYWRGNATRISTAEHCAAAIRAMKQP